jgi:hypothetical protein
LLVQWISPLETTTPEKDDGKQKSIFANEETNFSCRKKRIADESSKVGLCLLIPLPRNLNWREQADARFQDSHQLNRFTASFTRREASACMR